jgi:5-deoxy-glucuronate isomerase
VSLLVKGARSGGRDIVTVTPGSGGLRYVGFSAHRLADGARLEIDPGPGREVCVVVLAGVVTVRAGDAEFRGIGRRRSVFDDVPPFAAYLPGAARVAVQAHAAAEVAICTAPGTGRLPPRLIGPEEVGEQTRGIGANTRYVRNILPESAPAESLLVVEVITPAGHWSHAVEDHDVVVVPRGYHPVVVPYGYSSWYLNVMAGPKRAWRFKNDPAHEWILEKDPRRER